MLTRAPVTPSRRLRLLRRLGGALLALPLVALLAMNGLLGSGLLSHLLSLHPQWLMMEWRQAWTLRPGVVEVRDFHLRAQDRHIQWELTVDRATADIDLMALLHQTFRTRSVLARGVEFRWRPALSPLDSTPARLLGRPPITGVPEGAELTPSPPEPEPDGWSVWLQGVTVDEVREVWLGAFRVPMDARVPFGEVRFFPGQFVRLSASRLELTRAEVFRGVVPLAHHLFGSLECALDLEDWEDTRALRPFAHLDAALQVEGRLNPLGDLGVVLPVALELGGASLDLVAQVEQGRVRPGSRLTLGGEEAVGTVPPFVLRGLWRAEGVVDEVDGAVRSSLAVAVRPLRVEDTAGVPLLESPGFTATLAAPQLVLGRAPGAPSVRVALETTAPFALPPVVATLELDRASVTAGQAAVAASLSLGPETPARAGRLEATVAGLHAGWGGVRLAGNVAATVDLARLRPDADSFDLAGSALALTEVAFLSPTAQPPGWSGQVTLVQAVLTPGPPARADVEFSGRFSDARPFLALLGKQAGVPDVAMSFLHARDLRTHAWVTLRGDRLEVQRLLAEAEGVKLDSRLVVTPRAVSGVLLVSAGPLQVGLRLGGDAVEAHVLDGASWFRAQHVAAP